MFSRFMENMRYWCIFASCSNTPELFSNFSSWYFLVTAGLLLEFPDKDVFYEAISGDFFTVMR